MSKIGILIDAIHTGGVEKIAIRQVEALNKIGQEAELVVLRRTTVKNHPFTSALEKIKIVYLDDRLPWVFKLSFKLPLFSYFSLFHITYPLFLPWVIKKGEYKILLSHGTYTTFTAFTLKLIKNIPFFVLIWDPMRYIIKRSYPSGIIKQLNFILLPLAYFFDKLIVIKANLVIIGGRSHLHYLKTLGAKKISVIYPGVDPLKKLPLTRKEFILAVTSWTIRKKPEYNLAILEKMTNATMIIAGNWHPASLESEFKKIVKNKKLTQRVKVTGPLKENELSRLYSSARVLLQTNDDRGFGMPALEAAAHGCPFVIPVGQGVGELFTEGEDGYFTKERDTKTIIEKLKTLLKDQDKAKKMGASGWRKVTTSYSWEKHAQKLAAEVSGF